MTHPGQRVDEGAVRGRGEVGVGLQRAVEVDGGGDADADAFAADGVADGLCHFDDEAGTGLGGTAVVVGALVGGGSEELVQEVAIGAVQLDAVQAGGSGGAGEFVDDDRNVLGGQGARGGS
ncbi:hypothetical protein JOF35_004138 [Streptomyces demainii]|uniref:Uncharacterized protein n=1 Tax=Streptomyces demainii TaxID=588122 RepID=A0ABT9KTW2_9ACTN|nr:hypothetical protein [Streptomyces demainii]